MGVSIHILQKIIMWYKAAFKTTVFFPGAKFPRGAATSHAPLTTENIGPSYFKIYNFSDLPFLPCYDFTLTKRGTERAMEMNGLAKSYISICHGVMAWMKSIHLLWDMYQCIYSTTTHHLHSWEGWRWALFWLSFSGSLKDSGICRQSRFYNKIPTYSTFQPLCRIAPESWTCKVVSYALHLCVYLKVCVCTISEKIGCLKSGC